LIDLVSTILIRYARLFYGCFSTGRVCLNSSLTSFVADEGGDHTDTIDSKGGSFMKGFVSVVILIKDG
jgi:hypothetical protein